MNERTLDSMVFWSRKNGTLEKCYSVWLGRGRYGCRTHAEASRTVCRPRSHGSDENLSEPTCSQQTINVTWYTHWIHCSVLL